MRDKIFSPVRMYRKNGDFIDYQDTIPEYEPSRRSGFSRLRTALFALIMLTALVGGSVYQAWNIVPWILGYWDNHYQIIISEVYTGECGTKLHDSGTFINTLCVCGILDSGTGTADFGIAVRNEAEETIARSSVRGLSAGEFCTNLLLEKQIITGTYIIGIKPRLARSEILRTRVQLVDPNPQVWEIGKSKLI